MEAGRSSGVLFPGSRLRSAIGNAPADDKLIRTAFVEFGTRCREAIAASGTVAECEKALDELAGFYYQMRWQIEAAFKRDSVREYYWVHLFGRRLYHFFDIRHRRSLVGEARRYEASNDWSWAQPQPREQRPREQSGLPPHRWPRLAHIVRRGGQAIPAEMVSVTGLRTLFGFREVEFGNWMEDRAASAHIRNLMESLSDLYEVLDMDPRYLQTQGKLSIGFGSRGRPEAHAHYEPSRRIVNLTKTAGDGSVAHEFGHVFDHVLGDAVSGDATVRFASRECRRAARTRFPPLLAVTAIVEYIHKRTPGSAPKIVRVVFPAWDGEVPGVPLAIDPQAQIVFLRLCHPELADLGRRDEEFTKCYGWVASRFGLPDIAVDFALKCSDFLLASRTMPSPYWPMPEELFARAFEVFVFDSLAAAKRTNNYLVSDSLFAENVYPHGVERDTLGRLFADLISTVKTACGIRPFRAGCGWWGSAPPG